MCVCEYICMYVYFYVCVYIFMYVCIFLCVHVYFCVCVCWPMHDFMYVYCFYCAHICLYIYICKYVYSFCELNVVCILTIWNRLAWQKEHHHHFFEFAKNIHGGISENARNRLRNASFNLRRSFYFPSLGVSVHRSGTLLLSSRWKGFCSVEDCVQIY